MVEEFQEIVIPSYLKEQVEIQERIINITELGLNDFFNYLQESYLNNEDFLLFIIKEICYVSQIRYKMIPVLTLLSKLIIKSKKCEKLFVTTTLNLEANHLLYSLYINKLISLQSIEENQKLFSKQAKLFFSPFIKSSVAQEDDDLAEEIDNFDFDEHHKMILNGWKEGSIGYSLKNDDFDTLQSTLSKNPNFQLEKPIKWSDYENYFEYKWKTPLSLAALYGSISCFKYLILNNCQINEDVFCSAIKGGNLEIIRICQQNVEDRILKNYTACYDAASKFRRMDVFEWLLTQGFKLSLSLYNCVLYPNYRVLIFACDREFKDDDTQNLTAYELAITKEDIGAVKYLANHGLMNTRNFTNIVAKIADIIENGSISLANVLIQVTTPLKGKVGEKGNSLIHFAAKRGSNDTIDYLLDRGMQIDKKNHYGQTPLHIACENGNVNTIEFLLQNEADINAKDKLSQTPLITAMKCNKEDAASFLIINGCKVNEVDYHSWSALFYAAEVGNIKLIKLLIEKKADIDIQDQDGYTPFQVAVLNNKIEASNLLRSDEDGSGSIDIFFTAVTQGNIAIVKDQLSKGIDVNQKKNGVTPLMIAASNDDVDMIKILLEKGADTKARDSNGRTPQQIARKQKTKKLLKPK